MLRSVVSLCIAAVLQHGHATGQTIEALTRLRRNVFNKYVPVIPFCGAGPVVVNFDWNLYTLVHVDDVIEILDLTSWYRLHWLDCALAWNASHYGGVTSSEFPANLQVWTPDVTWMERIPSVDAFEFAAGIFSGARSFVTSDGTVTFSRIFLMRLYCRMTIQFFPFDTQRCNITFTLWSYDTSEAVLTSSQQTANINEMLPSDSWNIISVPLALINTTDLLTGNVYAQLQYELVMTRKPVFYLFYLMLPFFVISILNCFVFLIPPQAQEKIAFSLAILLSFSMYMMLMINITPPKPEIPLLSIYFFTVYVLSILSTALTVLVEVAHAHHSPHSPPAWLSMLFISTVGRFAFFQLVKHYNEGSSYLSRSHTHEQEPNANANANANASKPQGGIVRRSKASHYDHVNEWRKIAYAADRIFFILYCVISIVVFATLVAVASNLQKQLKT